MSQQEINSMYKTEKLAFAAYLIAAGKAELVGTEPIKNGRFVLFRLSSTPGEQDVTGFFSGNATVSALRFSESMNTLRAAAQEGRRRQNTCGTAVDTGV